MKEEAPLIIVAFCHVGNIFINIINFILRRIRVSEKERKALYKPFENWYQ